MTIQVPGIVAIAAAKLLKRLLKKRAEKQIAAKGKKEAKKALDKARKKAKKSSNTTVSKIMRGGSVQAPSGSAMKKAGKEAAKIGGVLATGAAIGKAIPDGPIDKKNKRSMEKEKAKKKKKSKSKRNRPGLYPPPKNKDN